MKHILYLLFILLLAHKASCQIAKQVGKTDTNSVRLTIANASNKSEVSMRQPVDITVRVSNQTKDKILVVRKLLAPVVWRSFVLQVHDPSGKELPLPTNAYPSGSMQVLWVKPLESEEFTFDLDQFCHLSELGTYEVSLKLKIGVQDQPYESIQALSNPLRLKVVP